MANFSLFVVLGSRLLTAMFVETLRAKAKPRATRGVARFSVLEVRGFNFENLLSVLVRQDESKRQGCLPPLGCRPHGLCPWRQPAASTWLPGSCGWRRQLPSLQAPELFAELTPDLDTCARVLFSGSLCAKRSTAVQAMKSHPLDARAEKTNQKKFPGAPSAVYCPHLWSLNSEQRWCTFPVGQKLKKETPDRRM